MVTLRAHFDGHVIVPDEPLNLRPGSDLELQIREIPTATTSQPEDAGVVTIGKDPITGFPVLISPPGSPPLTLEDMKRVEDEDF